MKSNKILACSLCNGNCMGCFWSDVCNQYNDCKPYNALVLEEIRDENGRVVDRRPVSDEE